MASRSSLLVFSAVLALVPGVVLAQADSSAPPPDVDKALRTNVSQFFQDFVDGKFRQALNLVADDTQDKYFASTKAEITGFNIDGIKYADDFKQATVKVTVKRIWHMRAEGFAQDQQVPTTWDTNWKIENGKWAYYEPPVTGPQWTTPMGPSAAYNPAVNGNSLGKREINDQTMAAEAQRILSGNGIVTSVTPKEIKFTKGKPGAATLTFTNGQPGAVQISVEGISEDLPVLASKVDKASVNSGEKSSVEVIYDPTSGDTPPGSVTLGVLIAPFNQLLTFTVSFDEAAN